MVWAVLPGFSITTTIIGIRIRMSALTYANKLKLSQALPLGKNTKNRSLKFLYIAPDCYSQLWSKSKKQPRQTRRGRLNREAPGFLCSA